MVTTAFFATVALLAGLWPLPQAVSREQGTRVPVPAAVVRIMDGDTAELRWSVADAETVRILGIDTAELVGGKRHQPLPQRVQITTRGAEARGFARGAFAASTRTELLRSTYLDRYGRTLGYFFLNGKNYSVLVIEAGLSRETITRYGDNGLPREAKEVLEAARRRK